MKDYISGASSGKQLPRWEDKEKRSHFRFCYKGSYLGKAANKANGTYINKRENTEKMSSHHFVMGRLRIRTFPLPLSKISPPPLLPGTTPSCVVSRVGGKMPTVCCRSFGRVSSPV